MENKKLLQFNSIKNLWENELDTVKLSSTYPKKLKNADGTYTEKFLKYNRKLLKDNRTFYYLGSDKIYNPKTEKFSEIKYDKRYKNKVKLTKATINKKPVWNTSFKTIETQPQINNYEQTYIKDVIKKINAKPVFNNAGVLIPYEAEIDLTKIKFSRFISIVKSKAPESNLISTTPAGGGKWVAFSQDNLQRIVEYDELTYQDDGSDMEFLFNAIKSNGIIRIKTTPKTKYQKPAGSFFKYFNNTKFDLSRYDIYKSTDKLNFENNCLYVAFENLGMDKQKLNEYKIFVKCGLVPVSSLNKLCEKLKIHIKLTKFLQPS